MPALAFSNNDIAIVAWTFDDFLKGCLGFEIVRIDSEKTETRLPAKARFAGQDIKTPLTTHDAPIQKYWWRDLYAKRGGTYTYRITPMTGTPGKTLSPLPGIEPLFTNSVTLTEKRPPFSAYFNRGIVATQALAAMLNHKPSYNALQPHIQDPNDKIRQHLMGQLFEGVTSLLTRADNEDGAIRAALYELDDPQGLEKRLQANPGSRAVMLGNERDDKLSPPVEDKDSANRAALKKSGVKVIDRILGKGDIPHNKFQILSLHKKPAAVLTGSTNWTSTGLCTQTNNVLVINSSDVANKYSAYWDALQADIAAAKGKQSKLQSPALRSFCQDQNKASIKNPIDLGDGVTIEVMFSPNTKGKLKKNPDTPNDMGRVFELMARAKNAILFLAFDPGNNSILDAAGKALAANPKLFVRGALTNVERAANFSKSLDGEEDAESTKAKRAEIKVVGEPGAVKKKGVKPKKKLKIDYRAIPAGKVTKDDAFGAWEAELGRYGFAIIHNKIVVIDPFSDDCVVVTGSHNLGFRASHNNDENFVIVHGHRALAEAYACHVLDVYDHYAWRYWLERNPDIFGKPLEGNDQWQNHYIVGPDEKSPELRFWLSSMKSMAAASTETEPAGKSAKKKAAATKPGQKKR